MTAKVLPVDQNSFPINVLKWGDTVVTPISAVSARVALPATINHKDIIRVATSVDCYVALGDSSVTATSSDPLFLAGVEYIQVAPGQTHIAAVRLGTDGTLTATEVY